MTGQPKILVVEDEIPVAMMMVSLLTRIGFDVQVATKAHKGLEIAHEQKFDLIVLESHLAGISNYEILEDLRQRHISYRTPIILLFDQNADRERAFSHGANDAIQKPFNAEDFIARVLSAVEETETA